MILLTKKREILLMGLIIILNLLKMFKMKNNLIQEETTSHILTNSGLFRCKHCNWVWSPRKKRPLMCPNPKCKQYLVYDNTRWLCLDCNDITESMHSPRMCLVCGNDKFKEE